jgi:hypothetical protein
MVNVILVVHMTNATPLHLVAHNNLAVF